jgi:hypothetical protein
VRFQHARLTLREIADDAHVQGPNEEVRLGRVAVLIVAALLLAPLAFLALALPIDLYRFRRHFYRRTDRSSADVGVDEATAVEVLTFSCERAWWLDVDDGSGRGPAALVLDAADTFVVLGAGWPEAWTTRPALFRRWVVFRSRADGRVMGIRAWGRCPIRNATIPAQATDFGNRVVVHTRAELPPTMSRLVATSGPYR